MTVRIISSDRIQILPRLPRSTILSLVRDSGSTAIPAIASRRRGALVGQGGGA